MFRGHDSDERTKNEKLRFGSRKRHDQGNQLAF